MDKNLKDRPIHPFSLLLMAIIFLLATFCKLKTLKLSLLYFVLFPYLFQGQKKNQVNFTRIIYIVFAVFLMVVLKVIYAHDSLHEILKYAIRLFFLFTVSTFSFSAVDFDKVFIYLMATRKIKTIWGYPLILAINSLQLLKREQERIAFNTKLRGLKWHQRYLVFFPLLVFAIRHSERGAMALVTRGLNPHKLFYNAWLPSKRDRAILISYFLLTLTFFLVG
jgi:hypothetical protein